MDKERDSTATEDNEASSAGDSDHHDRREQTMIDTTPDQHPKTRCDGRAFVPKNSLTEEMLRADRDRARENLKRKKRSEITPEDIAEERKTSNRFSEFKSRQRRKKIVDDLKKTAREQSQHSNEQIKEIAELHAKLTAVRQENASLREQIEIRKASTQTKNSASSLPSHGLVVLSWLTPNNRVPPQGGISDLAFLASNSNNAPAVFSDSHAYMPLTNNHNNDNDNDNNNSVALQEIGGLAARFNLPGGTGLNSASNDTLRELCGLSRLTPSAISPSPPPSNNNDDNVCLQDLGGFGRLTTQNLTSPSSASSSVNNNITTTVQELRGFSHLANNCNIAAPSTGTPTTQMDPDSVRTLLEALGGGTRPPPVQNRLGFPQHTSDTSATNETLILLNLLRELAAINQMQASSDNNDNGSTVSNFQHPSNPYSRGPDFESSKHS